MQVEREPRSLLFGDSSARVSNAWVTYPRVGDNSPKGELIPNVFLLDASFRKKAGQPAPLDRPAFHQFVGGVMAYQDYDG